MTTEHVLPAAGRDDHDIDPDCWCGPEQQVVVVSANPKQSGGFISTSWRYVHRYVDLAAVPPGPS